MMMQNYVKMQVSQQRYVCSKYWQLDYTQQKLTRLHTEHITTIFSVLKCMHVLFCDRDVRQKNYQKALHQYPLQIQSVNIHTI